MAEPLAACRFRVGCERRWTDGGCSSYGLVRFPNGTAQHQHAIAAVGQSIPHREPAGRIRRSVCGHIGGNPHPITASQDVQFIPFGAYGATDPDINSPRVQSWNVTVERQIGVEWGVAASYLAATRIGSGCRSSSTPPSSWVPGPCTINGGCIRRVQHGGQRQPRRRFSLSNENPASAALIGNLDLHEHRRAELSRSPAFSAPALGERNQPQRQLHDQPLFRRQHDRRISAARARADQPGRP